MSRHARSMAFLLPLLILALGVIYSAAQISGHGHAWADQVCATSFGLCDHSVWIPVAIGALVLVGFGLSRRTA